MHEMKDSGIAWIGEIPREWESKRLKYLVTYNDEVLDEKTDDSFEFNYIDIGSVEYGKGITQFQHMRYADAPSRARRIVKKDDVILSTVRTYLKAVATISASDEPQIASTGFAVLRARENEICPAFLNYAVLSDAFISTVEARSVGISYPAINASDVVTIAIPIPKLPEQRRIADFLDTECARIDAVIEQTRASIEEYKKLKQSVITEAVTKGIRPGRKMKDSGIEWIGEIPEEWQLFRLKDYYRFEKGKNAAVYTQSYIAEHEGDFPVFSGQTENNGIMGKINTYDYDIDECLFTTTVGAKVMTPNVLRGKFSLSQNCLIMLQIQKCNNRYIYYALFPLFRYAKSLIPSYMQPSLRVSDLNKYSFYTPNYEEQGEIADYLDGRCCAIDELIEQKEKLLSELESYKKSLIFEYVTGKKEVPV